MGSVYFFQLKLFLLDFPKCPYCFPFSCNCGLGFLPAETGYFCSLMTFLMKTAMFCFGRSHFLLTVGNMLEPKFFRFPGFDLFDRQYNPPALPLILADIEIFLYSVLIIDIHIVK